ncbi:MAG: MBL fold metallo-hydrolase [Clostridia bacterium]|nr:MBL fold metallo-hydrolase [Clostridia bacterium]
MKSKAILSLCLAAIMLFMSACTQNGESESSSSDAISTENVLQTEDITTEEETTAEATTESPHPVLTPVTADDIPYFSGGSKRSDYDCGDGVHMKVVTSVFEREYLTYIESLKTQGYTEVSAREVKEEYFYTFSREGTALIASYSGTERIARLTILPYNPYEAYSDIYGVKNAEQGDVEPLITMVDSGNNGNDVGMSYIIRTTKGSFIVIDGGWVGIGEGKKIRNILKEQNTNGSLPVIAAWILTHPHSDHYGAIADVASAYYDEVVLERVIYNYMSEEMLAKSDVAKVLNDSTAPYNILKKTLSAPKKWGYTQVIKPHAGDLLNIDGVEIDILYTHEEVAPDISALEYNNAASLAFKVNLGEKSVLFLGDSTGTNMLAMAKRYGTHLKSDVLQPTHHGRTHGKIDVYKLVLPEVVLWDCALSSYKEYENQDYNQYLIKNFKRHYISQNGTVSLSFKTLEEIAG